MKKVPNRMILQVENDYEEQYWLKELYFVSL